MCCLRAYYDDYTYRIPLRYVTFVCNNTLDILPDVRYVVVFLVYIVSLSQHHMDERLREWWFGQYVERFHGMSFYYLHSREQHVCMFCCRVQGQYQPRTGSMVYNAQALYSSYRPGAYTVPIQCSSAHCTYQKFLPALINCTYFSSANWTHGFVIDSVSNVVTGVQTGTSTPKGPTATR